MILSQRRITRFPVFYFNFILDSEIRLMEDPPSVPLTVSQFPVSITEEYTAMGRAMLGLGSLTSLLGSHRVLYCQVRMSTVLPHSVPAAPPRPMGTIAAPCGSVHAVGGCAPGVLFSLSVPNQKSLTQTNLEQDTKSYCSIDYSSTLEIEAVLNL